MMKNGHRLVVCLVACVVLGWGLDAQARRSTKKLNKSWETLMGNRLVLSYYSLELLGDLFKAGVYKKPKVRRYLQMMRVSFKKQKAFLKKVRVPGGRSNRRLFRRLRGAVDLMVMGAESLDDAAKKGSVSDFRQYVVYRKSAAQDIGKILTMRALSRTRYYRGGWRGALRRLGHCLGEDLVFAYLLVGMVADGYFQARLGGARGQQYLKLTLGLLRASANSAKVAGPSVPLADRGYVLTHAQKAVLLARETKALYHFIKTRKRGYLQLYRKWRAASWSTLRGLGGS